RAHAHSLAGALHARLRESDSRRSARQEGVRQAAHHRREGCGARDAPRGAAKGALVRGRGAALALVAVLGLLGAAPAPSNPPPLVVERTGQGKAEIVPIRTLDEHDYLAARDLARLVGASVHWRSDVRKLVVRTVHHDLKFVVDSRWVVLDEGETFQLDAPARQVQGEVWVPVSVFETILSGRFVPQARLARGHLLLVADEPDAGPPQLTVDGAITRL